MAGEHEASWRRLEDRLAHLETADYVLTLFVNGASDMSVRAIGNVRALCEVHLDGRYQLEVVDVHRDAELMAKHQVLAVPTLIREQPLPERRIVGDLSNASRVLAALDIRTRTTPERGYG